MQTDEVQKMVDRLAQSLQRSVAIDDQNIRLIAASKHFGDQDPVRIRAVLARELDRETARFLLRSGITEAQEPMFVDANPDRQLKARWCCPLRWDNRLLGFLWLINDKPLTENDRDEAVAVARDISMVLFGRRLSEQRRSTYLGGLVRDLLSSDLNVARKAERDLSEELLLRAGDTVAVVVFVPAGPIDQSESERLHPHLSGAINDLRGRFGDYTVIPASLGHRYVVLMIAPDRLEDELSAAAQRLANLMIAGAEEFTEQKLVAGVGVCAAPLQAHYSFKQAKTAARGAAVLPGWGPTVTWHNLGVFGQLLQLVERNSAELALPGPTQSLIDADHSGILVPTAIEFLDSAGNTAITAEHLHIHRSTLYYRLNKIETATGLSLSSGIDRLTLHLGLKLAQVAGLSLNRKRMSDRDRIGHLIRDESVPDAPSNTPS